MERENLLCVLIVLFAGAAFEAFGWWPAKPVTGASGRELERYGWRRIWMPAVPALLCTAWLTGWALSQPDPVPVHVPLIVIIVAIPFGVIALRAAVRALWSLVGGGNPGIATVGLIRPWIVFSPKIARSLDDNAVEAALAHERAHARHRDPMRIWLAQLATDLQWPWPQAYQRFRNWLLALELARDEEARVAGAEGPELASAILATLKLSELDAASSSWAALIGEPSILKERIARLLAPLTDGGADRRSFAGAMLVASLVIAIAAGLIFGGGVIDAMFRAIA